MSQESLGDQVGRIAASLVAKMATKLTKAMAAAAAAGIPVERLGRVPDAAIAAETGVDVHAVGRIRRGLGIRRELDPAITARIPTDRLGRARDSVLARELGIPVAAIARRRRECGIAKFRPPLPLHRLGIDQDEDIAKLSGTSRHYVAKIRKQLSIRKAPRPTVVGRIPVGQLGVRRDTDIARETGVSLQSVAAYRRSLGIPRASLENEIPTEVLESGTAAEVAEKLGVSQGTVFKRRHRAGIRCRRIPTIPKERLGVDADVAIARDLGISQSSVCKYRLRLGIPAAGRWPEQPEEPKSTEDDKVERLDYIVDANGVVLLRDEAMPLNQDPPLSALHQSDQQPRGAQP